MRRIPLLILAITMSGLQQSALAADTGAAMIEQQCQQCHDNAIFSRPDSILSSYGELDARVRFCDKAAKTHWNETQMVTVIEYLNNTYYNFKKKF